MHNFGDHLLRGVVKGGSEGQDCFDSPEGFTLAWGTSTPSAAAGYAPGCLFSNTSTGVVSRNTGTKASSTFTTISASSDTLDAAFDNGKIINGADSRANAMQVGDGTDALEFYELAGALYIGGTAAGSADLNLIPDGNLNLNPNGGTTAVTGAMTVSGNLTVSGSISGASIAQDAIVASTPDTALSLDGQGTGGVTIGTTSTGNIALQRNITTAASRTLIMAGVAASTVFTITAGDAVMSDGSLTITDADDAAALSVINNTTTSAAGVVSVSATAVDTGIVVAVDASGITTGDALRISCTQATLTTGNYINCYDGAATDFEVGRYGAIIVAGNAAGTDILTATKGDITLTAGYLTLTNGRIQIDSTGDLPNYIKRNQATTTGPLLELETTNTSDDEVTLLLDSKQTAGVNSMEIAYAGTANCLSAVCSAATGTALSLSGAASATDSVVKVINAGTGATGFLGATGIGMVNITSDGDLAHANASMLLITYSGSGAATGLGTCLRIVDTGGTATSYAAYISAGTGEALQVAAGTCLFAEQIELGGGFKTTTGAFVVSDSGAASMDIDGGAANDTLNIGASTDTDTALHGTTAGKDFLWDASENQVKLGGTATRAGAAGDSCLTMFNGGAAPAGTLVNGISLYSEGGECKVIDAAGNVTVLSPHTKLEGGVGDLWTLHTTNSKGKTLHVDMELLLKDLVEINPTLKKYFHEIAA